MIQTHLKEQMDSMNITQYNMSNELKEKFNALFPSWATVLACIIAFTILLWIITKLVWKPVMKMVADRKSYIQNNIDESSRKHKKAQEDREQANDELVEAKIEAARIVEHSKLIAERKATDIRDKAQLHSSNILEEAKREIRMQKDILATEAKEEMVEVALAAAQKIVEKEVDNDMNRKLINDFIKQK